ncbi:MAG: hypothetical protein U1E05_26955, partial [Patescibacteria group bacterium]|nr:hypothetical protein [Patescibacteria group bacterium]
MSVAAHASAGDDIGVYQPFAFRYDRTFGQSDALRRRDCPSCYERETDLQRAGNSHCGASSGISMSTEQQPIDPHLIEETKQQIRSIV